MRGRGIGPRAVLLAIAASALVLQASIPRVSAQPDVDRLRAIVRAVEGDVTVRGVADAAWSPLLLRQILSTGDRIRTGANGKVIFQVGELGAAEIGPNSIALVRDVRRTEEDGRPTDRVFIDLLGGRIDGSLRRLQGRTGDYRFYTPVGTIGVRGTTLRVVVAAPPNAGAASLDIAQVRSAGAVVDLLDGAASFSGPAGEVPIGAESRLGVLADGSTFPRSLPADVKAELQAFRDEAARIVADPNYVPGTGGPVPPPPDSGLPYEALIDRLQARMVGLLEAYERCDEMGFIDHLSDDFRGQFRATEASTFFDKWRVRDSLEETCRELFNRRVEVNVRTVRLFESNLVAELTLDWRERFYRRSSGDETMRENLRSTMRWRWDDVAEDWYLVWWEGDPIFTLFDPVTGEANTSLCDVSWDGEVDTLGDSGAVESYTGKSVCIKNSTLYLNGTTLEVIGGTFDIENSTLVGPGSVVVSGATVNATGSTVSGGAAVTISSSTGAFSSCTFDGAPLTLTDVSSFNVSGGSFMSSPSDGILFSGSISSVSISSSVFDANGSNGLDASAATGGAGAISSSNNTYSNHTVATALVGNCGDTALVTTQNDAFTGNTAGDTNCVTKL